MLPPAGYRKSSSRLPTPSALSVNGPTFGLEFSLSLRDLAEEEADKPSPDLLDVEADAFLVQSLRLFPLILDGLEFEVTDLHPRHRKGGGEDISLLGLRRHGRAASEAGEFGFERIGGLGDPYH